MFHISNTSSAVLVPPEAANLTTPLNHGRWQLYLSDHPDAALTEFFIIKIIQRFRLGFNGTLFSLNPACKNLDGALQYPLVVYKYITEEIIQHRLIGSLIIQHRVIGLLFHWLILAILELFQKAPPPTSGD